jgi:phosphatidylglycerophosphate synthase
MNGSFSDLADRVGVTRVFVVVGPEGGHRLDVGGLTVLERVLFGLVRKGVVMVDVAAEPLPLRADLGRALVVVWAPPDGAPPEDGSRVVVRGDELDGVRVVDRASAEALERAMCLALGKSHQGLIDAWINWRLSTPLTRRLAHTRLRPNHVTTISAGVGLAGSLSLLGGSWACVALGGLLLQAQSVLDSCDGELARLRFQGSKFGQWFDNIADDVLDLTFVACAGVAAGGAWLPLAVATSLFRAWAQAMAYHEVWRRHGSGDIYAFRIWFQADKRTSDEVFAIRGVGDVIRAFGRRDAYVFMWMVLCLLGQPQLVVAYGSVLSLFIGGMMVAHLVMRSPLPPPRR